MYGSSDRGWEFIDSKTCIYPYETRDASAFASAGGYETTRGSRERFRRCGIGTRLFVVASSARRNADGASVSP